MTNRNPAKQASGADAKRSAGPPGGPNGWPSVLNAFRDNEFPLPEPWEKLFGGLRGKRVAVGQMGQSLDGRIATPSGHSHYINGADGLDHLHRLRALMDAVVIGIGTALADDPQLTVRRVEGRNPARVVIDPNGRLPATARLLKNDGVRRIIFVKSDVRTDFAQDVEVLPIKSSGQIAPADILSTLQEAGLSRVLIEGGANTVSRFLAANCLDRLHVMVAPIILGSGPAGISLPPIERASDAMKPAVHVHPLGNEVLFDCDISAQRLGGRAKKST